MSETIRFYSISSFNSGGDPIGQPQRFDTLEAADAAAWARNDYEVLVLEHSKPGEPLVVANHYNRR